MLILKAVCLIDPPIDIESGFKKAALSNFLNGAGMHPDLVGHYPTLDRQKITLKLHTAETEGANVVLANAGLGDIWDIGDREDYDELSGIPCRSVIDYGYDYENSEGILEDSRRFQYESGSYDPIYSEPDFYQYQQGPYCSVLFRSLTTMGPASVHRFNAINPGVDRNVLVSQLDVLGQDHREAS